MKRALAVLVLVMLPLLAAADVAVPPETTGSTATESRRTAWPIVFLSLGGVVMVVLIAARRRKTAPPAQ